MMKYKISTAEYTDYGVLVSGLKLILSVTAIYGTMI
eukprot:SAG31_NODE_76_length_27534_cov_13.661868_11_plen_36_part_00